MRKLTKRDYINLIIISLLVISIFFILTKRTYIYGSTTDWKDQHYLLPEYFRNLFYATGNLIPDFALNIGGGQNIFNFAYYGLFNPIIFISYFLPFIDMMHYIIISSVIVVIVSSILFYKWLKNNDMSTNVCFISTIIFTLASPLLLHSHRHIMFMNYMPFLLLGLIGIDKYYKDKKFFLITLSTSLMIFTSYYYSVSGIVVLGIYFIYKYLKENGKLLSKDFFKNLIKFAYFILLSIFICGVLLLPVFYTILSGRSGTTTDMNILKLFKPTIDIGYILYDSYGIGLTSIAVIALANLSSSKANKFLITILLIIFCLPLSVYLLNGTLYINAKVLIPFLPLMCYIISLTIDKILNLKINVKRSIIVLAILLFISYFTNNKKTFEFFLFDSIVVMLSILIYFKKNKRLIIYIPLIVISFINCYFVNNNDKLYKKSDYLIDFNENVENSIKEINKTDRSFYRINNNLSTLSTINKIYDINYYQSSLYSSTYNGNYNKFYTNIFQNEIPYRNSIINSETNNLLFQIYMGEKYIITNKNPNLGYELISENEDYKIYKNTNVQPIGYATNKIIDKEIYKKLKYPYNVEALLNYIVVDNVDSKNIESNILDYDLSDFSDKFSELPLEILNNKYHFVLKEKTNLSIPLNEKMENKILIISFDMKYSEKCSKGDTYIIINGIKNKLTCKSWKYHNNNYSFNYVLASEVIDKLDIQFSKGEYLIDNIKAYTLDYENIKKFNDDIDEFSVKRIKTYENTVAGNINVSEDGYFILKIPYDKGFHIYIDDEEVEVLNVNDGFIGTKIDKGKHDIKIVYHAPFLFLGKIISVIGILLFILSITINNNFEDFRSKFMNNKIFKFLIEKYKKYEEVINYLFIGGCTTVVSFVTYALCSSLLGIHYQISNVISWVFAVTFAFITNKLFVFKIKSNKNLFNEIYQFIKFRVLSLFIDMGLMYVLVEFIHMNDLLAKVIVQVVVVVLNYVFSKLFIFKKDK